MEKYLKNKRDYLKNILIEGNNFVQKIINYPLEESHEELVPIKEAFTEINIEIYYSDKKKSFEGPKEFYIRKRLISKLISAAKEMNNYGMILKIEDSYRSLNEQKELNEKAA